MSTAGKHAETDTRDITQNHLHFAGEMFTHKQKAIRQRPRNNCI